MTDTKTIPSLADYSLLGRSGLRVSPLCLGTMTFGTEWGWGSPAETAKQLLHRYLDAGGNFVDTANGYTNGKSEEMLGEFLQGPLRDRVVLATKYTVGTRQGDPNAAGNGRKNLVQSLEASLKRLRTDRIDLYWMHAWDGITPVEEVMSALDAQVRAGKILAVGLSDVPAWYAARAQTMAELRGWEKVAALQLEYSLVERNIEREHVPLAIELGMGVCPWSPLAMGLLSGKYKKTAEGTQGEGRVTFQSPGRNMASRYATDRNFAIVDALVAVARELGRSPAQVALNWITRRPGVTSTIVGATKLDQLDDNLGALAFDLPTELAAKLEQAGRPETFFPYSFFDAPRRAFFGGGVLPRAEPRSYRPRD